jgi:hypothetical protein
VTYSRGDHYWLEIVPLEPSLRVLTSWVLRAWDAKSNRLIYDHKRGRLGTRHYRILPAWAPIHSAIPQLGMAEYPTCPGQWAGGSLVNEWKSSTTLRRIKLAS